MQCFHPACLEVTETELQMLHTMIFKSYFLYQNHYGWYSNFCLDYNYMRGITYGSMSVIVAFQHPLIAMLH